MALDWLKGILGDAYTEDIDAKVSEEIGKHFATKTDFNNLNETKKTLEGQIKDRDKQLEELKKSVPRVGGIRSKRAESENNHATNATSKDIKKSIRKRRLRLFQIQRSYFERYCSANWSDMT